MTGFSQKPVSPAGGGPGFPPDRGMAAPEAATPVPVVGSARREASPVPLTMPLRGGRSEGAPSSSVGPGEGAISSAWESHGMPVPDFCAPSGLVGVRFLGGSLWSSLDPLGSSLWVFPASRSREDLQKPQDALPDPVGHLPSCCPGAWWLQGQEAGGCVRGATCPVLPFGFSVEPGPGPGYESGAACCWRAVGTVGRKRVSTPVLSTSRATSREK